MLENVTSLAEEMDPIGELSRSASRFVFPSISSFIILHLPPFYVFPFTQQVILVIADR